MDDSVHQKELKNQRLKNVTPYVLILITAVLCPTLEAICVNQITSAENTNIFTYIILIILVVHIICAIALASINSQSRHYADYVNLENKHRELKDRFIKVTEVANQTFACNQSIYMASVGLDDFLGDVKAPTKDKTYIGQILYPFINFRDSIFALSSKSLFNLALYSYNKETELLEVYYRHCDDRIPRRDREWHPGQGHVGLAFIRKKAILSTDATRSDELDLETTHGDSVHYRSFFSIPILATCDSHDTPYSVQKPLGVLVITSSEKNEFSREIHESTLLALSKLIAIYFEMKAMKILLFESDGGDHEQAAH